MSRRLLPLAPLVLLIAACGAGGTSPTPSAGTPNGVVVTLDVEGERYRIRLTEPADIEVARKLLAGEEAPGIPNGLVVRGDPDVNVGYSWHIDPNDIEWVDVTIEVCDGRPSDVEANEITDDRYCPWGAKVVAVE